MRINPFIGTYNQCWGSVIFKKTDSCGLDSIIILIKHFLSVLKLSKTFLFFRKTSGKYLTSYGQESIFTTDPCPYLVIYSPDALKK